MDGMCWAGKQCPCNTCTEGLLVRKQYAVDELGGAVETLEIVRKNLGEIAEGKGEPVDKITQAIDAVTKDIEQHGCPACADYMSGLQRKLEFLQNECGKDGKSCVIESELTIDRVRQMTETFMGSDDMIKRQEKTSGDTKETTKEETGRNAVKTEEASNYSEYHDCVQKNLREMRDSGDVGLGIRMCVASKMCKKDAVTKEEAIEQCGGE